MASIPVLALCALLLASSEMRAQQSSPMTAEDMVHLGIAQNRNLVAARERIAEGRGSVRQAGVRPAPDLNLRGTTGRPLGSLGEEQYGADLSQTIETFGKRSKRIEVAQFEVSQAGAELQQKSAELALQIRLATAERVAAQA